MPYSAFVDDTPYTLFSCPGATKPGLLIDVDLFFKLAVEECRLEVHMVNSPTFITGKREKKSY